MRNLILLTLTLTMSLSAFSQSVTDTLKIPLPKVIVKEVIKDLIKGDASKKEVVVLNDIIAQKSIQLSTKDTIIISLNQKIVNFGSIINTKDQQQSLNDQLVKDLEKALKKAKETYVFL